MQKFIDFVNKYGIVIHSLSAGFWLWIIYQNYQKMQVVHPNTPHKISFYIGIFLLVLSTFNLIGAIKKKFPKN